MREKLLVLIGTESGNAESLAEKFKESLEENGYKGIELLLIDIAENAHLADYRNVLIVTSTWGEGELPSGAIDFYDDILLQEKPNLTGTRFAICALGDHDYDPYFCEAGKLFSKTFTDLAATEISPMFEIDGEIDEEVTKNAIEWLLKSVQGFW